MNLWEPVASLVPIVAVGSVLAIRAAWKGHRLERQRQALVEPPVQEDPEKTFTISLGRLSRCVRASVPGWADKLSEAASRADDVLAKSSSIEKKFEFMRSIEAYFGGMGSLNDTPRQECPQEVHELWSNVQALLRIYWRQLGREYHDYSSFHVFHKGTRVKLVAGKVRYYESDGKPVHVISAEASLERLWTVERCDGPDITSMPHYLVSDGNKFMSARHEALAYDVESN